MTKNNRKWEYRVLTVGSFWTGVDDDALEEMLNEWGGEGWELVAFRTIENSNKATVVARRPLSLSARRQRSLPVY